MKQITKQTSRLSRYSLFIFLLCAGNLSAQLAVPFTVRYQNYVNGDITMIANNIVNRVNYLHQANEEYNNRTENAKINDQFTMGYIDIDDDPETFSSSNAYLNINRQDRKKIIYAGLYWSATYVTALTTTINDSASKNFKTIKLKLPNAKNYTNVQGELIFEGSRNPAFMENAPYAMYADITKLVKDSETAYGTYTVANIVSSTGKISGGVSAGWSIMFVYEDLSMPGKFITSFDGFAGVTNDPIDITFSGFQTLPKGNVNATIASMALEGDLKLHGDQLLLKSDADKEYSTISNKIRDKKNIFNSSISILDNNFINRFPCSMNTLGYDSFIVAIDNPNNSVIHNNTKTVSLRLKTYGDRYFVFFNAFAAEVTEPKEDASERIAGTVNENHYIASTTAKLVKLKKTSNSDTLSKNKKELKDTDQNFTNTSISKEYYLIANVFSKQKNAEKFIKKLDKQGLDANYFINPNNNYKYVYLSKKDSFQEVLQVYYSKLDGNYTDPSWVMTVDKKLQNQIKDRLFNTIAANEGKKAYLRKKQIIEKQLELTPRIAAIPKLSSQKLIQSTANKESINTTINQIQSPVVNSYYIIANVFAIESNANKFIEYLNTKGLKANYFINPKNNYFYVYLNKKNSLAEASKLQASKLNGKYQEKAWVLTVTNKSQKQDQLSMEE